MRPFKLLFHLVISTVLLSLTADGGAAHLKKNKQPVSSAKKTIIQHPLKKHKTAFAALQTKSPHRPNDVWERIRLGMQLGSLSDRFIFESKGKIALETVTLDISSLLKFSPVQTRLYKLQRMNIAALKISLKHPAPLVIHPAAEWHIADNTVKQILPVVHCASDAPARVSAVRIETPPPQQTGFMHTSFVQNDVYTPMVLPSFAMPAEEIIPKVPHRVCKIVNEASPVPRKKIKLRQQQQLKATNLLQPKILNARVSKQIAWFIQRPTYLQAVAERARPYIYHIVEELSRNKLPLELALLPIVESAYKPTAQSPMRAAGLWQFIPSTGRDFNLKQNEMYDERLDVTASTQAAIRFLSRLNKHFKGDWLLALAAYNCGAGNVDSAIKRNIAKGLPTDYWSLSLPEETQNYVPRLLALAAIFAHPTQYQLHVAPVKNEPYFVKVNIDSRAEIAQLANKELKTVASMANMTYEQFNRLNPSYLNKTLMGHGPFSFILPIANANLLQQQLIRMALIEPEQPTIAPLLSVQFKAETRATKALFSEQQVI